MCIDREDKEGEKPEILRPVQNSLSHFAASVHIYEG